MTKHAIHSQGGAPGDTCSANNKASTLIKQNLEEIQGENKEKHIHLFPEMPVSILGNVLI